MPLTKATVFLLLAAVTILVQEVATDDMRNAESSEESSCVSVEAVPLCADLGYVNTTFPNLRGHATPEETIEELSHFLGLIHTRCSNAIVHLLCSIYAPMCIDKFPNLRYPPCNSLCEYVKDDCIDILLEKFLIKWPPGPHLDCDLYDESDLCFGPRDPSILRLPQLIKCKSSRVLVSST